MLQQQLEEPAVQSNNGIMQCNRQIRCKNVVQNERFHLYIYEDSVFKIWLLVAAV
jgi:hypothetical protein